MIRSIIIVALLFEGTFAFTAGFRHSRASLMLFGTEDTSEDTEADLKNAEVEGFLEKKYPSFSNVLLNDEMRKAISEGKTTIFVPNESAIEQLGEKKMEQIQDPRNEEIRGKMGSYHLISGESISATDLKTIDYTKGRPTDGSKPNTLIAGMVTLSGEVPVGRSKSGGFFGFGGKEDGDIVVGPRAKIVQSFAVQDSLIHEMDDIVSPDVLWRYCDQLRIPGF
jgi:uncharacterized surface protein with fasciclin (FAS1) repeats